MIRVREFDLSTVYVPTERQRVFHSCPADVVLYGGAAGGGKSEALLWEAFIQCVETPGNKALLLRRTFPELNRSLIQRSLEKFPRSVCEWRASEKAWYFKNGSVLEFGYCERESDVHKYQSAEYGFIGFDELTHFTKYMWTYLVGSRLRSTVPGAWPRARAASNPGNIGHLWVKEMFVDKGLRDIVWEDETGVRYAFIPARVQDNPHLLKNDPDYIRRLQSLPEAERRALLEGDWNVFAGQYFPEWREDIHVVEPFEIPRWWKRFRSLDYGLDCTACYWWAVSPEGKLYVYRELYKPNLTLTEAAEIILNMTPKEEIISYTVASPDLWNRRQDRGISGAEIMAQAGLKGLVPADNRRVPGWRALREALKPYDDLNSEPDPVTGQPRKTARLQIFRNCYELIRTLPALVHDENDPEDVADECEDHGPEAIRYGIMSRPPKTVSQRELYERRRRRERLTRPVVSSITGY